MLKKLMNWLLGKDTPEQATRGVASNAQRAATMIAEAKPTIRATGPVAAPVAAMAEGAAVIASVTTAVSRGATGTAHLTRKPEQHEIALRAHQIWLERGGDATANWLQAEHELAERYGRR